MNLFLLPFPSIDPVLLNIGPVAIRWYGLAYMAGILLGWVYARRLAANNALWRHQAPVTPLQLDDLVLWVTVGIVVGGRLGYVLFYNPVYFFSNPLAIVQTWNGGMSFHGGLLGSIIAVALFARRHSINFLSLLDVLAATTPIGLFFGRLANFINGELWGRASDVPWAMIFPHPEAGGVPRHPSQLYEAALEGLVLFLVLRWLTHSRLALNSPGVVGGAFVAGYGLARIFVENFRQFEENVGLMIGVLTPGMLYSVPMVLIGGYLIWRGWQGDEKRNAA